ncbi:hypothetical protein [Streptomyces sp. NPDC018347]|uniref:hypothetical protein n=1 Tax=Streptomyces sp. NPDC018347 TaxID=3157193 RepID=UPI0034102AA5
MKKLMRRLAVTGIPVAIAGGALLAGGGPASAAPHPQGPADVPARVTSTVGERADRHPASGRRVDPWVLGQVATFDPAAARRLAVYDPWVKDQLALLTQGEHGR